MADNTNDRLYAFVQAVAKVAEGLIVAQFWAASISGDLRGEVQIKGSLSDPQTQPEPEVLLSSSFEGGSGN